jgi:WD40 repeat protein
VWDCKDGTLKHRFQPSCLKGVPVTQTIALAVNSNGDRVMLVVFGTVSLWDPATNRALIVDTPYHVDPVTCVVQHEGRSLVASGGDDGAVILWDRTTGVFRRSLVGFVPAISALAFNATGETLLAASKGGAIHAWDTQGRLRWKYQPSNTNTTPLALASHPHEPLVAAGMTNRGIVLLDAQNGTPKEVLHSGEQAITALAFSDDGTMLAGGTAKGVLEIWNMADKEVAARFGADGHLCDVRWLPGSNVVASAGDSAQFWDVGKKSKIWTLPVSGGPLKAMDLDRKQRLLVVVDAQGSVLRIDLPKLESTLESFGLSAPTILSQGDPR